MPIRATADPCDLGGRGRGVPPIDDPPCESIEAASTWFDRRLYLSNLVMYDRKHRDLWTQFEGEGLVGDLFLSRGELDNRFPSMARLVGLADGDSSIAVTVDHLTDQRTVDIEHDGRPPVVLWAPGQDSALDTTSIDAGRDVGQTAAFLAELDRQGFPLDLGAK